MATTSGNLKTLEIVKAYRENDYITLCRFFADATDELRVIFRKKDYSRLVDACDNIKSKFLFLKKEEEAKESISFQVGKIFGIIESISELEVDDNFKLLLFEDKKIDLQIKDIPHSEEVLTTLSNTSAIRHGKLAESVGVDKSTLSPIMNKLIDHKLISFTRVGKFKYYSISQLGKEYVDKRLKNDIKVMDLFVKLVKAKKEETSLLNDVKKFIESKKTDTDNNLDYYSKSIRKSYDINEKKIQSVFNSNHLYLNLPNRIGLFEVGKADVKKLTTNLLNSSYVVNLEESIQETKNAI